MKQIKLFILIFFSALSLNAQTGSISGIISDGETNETLFNAKVLEQNTGIVATTGNDGYFIFENLIAGTYNFLITPSGYESIIVEVILSDGEKRDLGILSVKIKTLSNSEEPVVSLSEDDLVEGQSSENISGMLHGSNDVFLSTAGYNLGPLRFKIRGYDADYTDVSINGIPMENLESDYVSWSNWGGLNNVTKNQVTTLGLTESDVSFGSVGGTSDIVMRASEYRKGTNITYSSLNKAYRNRAMATYSTGLMDNGWALTVSGSRRWAQEGYTEGTFYDAWSYFADIEKKFSDKHTLNFVVLGAPNRRGKDAASTQEVYDLLGNIYYNPNWGYQGDVKRNSKISNYHQPILMLTHYFTIDNTSSLTTSLSYKFGRGGQTSLDWYNTRDPRPDYYRNLPSYLTCTPEELDYFTQQFVSNTDYNQINWDNMYQANYVNYTEIENANGDGHTEMGNRSQYIVEERRNDEKYLAFNTNYEKEVSDKFTFRAGVQVLDYRIHNFQTMVDLLGGDFWVDNDKYAERDLATAYNTDITYNDINIPNHIIKEGDIFGYDYISNTQKAKIWSQAEFTFSKIDCYVAAFGSYSNIWRTGNMQNGKFPETSLGNSDKYGFLDYGVKGGATYKISGRHYLYARAGYLTNAPNFRNLFVSPRTREDAVAGVTSEKILSFDGGYALRAPSLKASVNFYYTEFSNQTEVKSFYLDTYRNFINYVIKGQAKTHQGIEIGVEANATSTITLSAIASFGYFRYTARPLVDIYVDNSAEALSKDKTIFIKNYLVAGTPQTAASAGIEYSAPKFWFLGLNVNYISNLYLDFNMERRTAEAVQYIIPNSDLYYATLDQLEAPAGFIVDLNGGKSFKFGDYTLFVNLSIGNILDNSFVRKFIDVPSLITGGYEQSRLDVVNYDIDKFPPKYYYNDGTNYYLNLSLRF